MTSFANVSHHHGYNLVIENRWFQKKCGIKTFPMLFRFLDSICSKTTTRFFLNY